MAGVFTFKPLQANLIYNQDTYSDMDPYCKIRIGSKTVASTVAVSEGVHPHWEDTLKIERKNDESFCYVKVRDKDLTYDDDIGEAKICLEPVEAKGHLIQWYTLYDKNRLAGEILIDIAYRPIPPDE